MSIKRKVRQSQTIVPFGVGAIFDLQGESFVATDITTWGKHGIEITSRRLAAKLGVQQFRSAPIAPDGKAQYWSGAPGPVFERFPRWLFCPSCRYMSLWRIQDEQVGEPATCGRCSGKQPLVPMRFIQICANGHMSDVDWFQWAHSRAETPAQRQCARRTLRFVVSAGESGGLGSLGIRCTTCKVYRSFQNVTQKDVLKRLSIRCLGKQPWQRPEDATDCDETPRVVQRGASNVYFSLVHSAIDIPNLVAAGEEDDATRRVHDHKLWPDLCSSPAGPTADMARRYIAMECDVTEDFVDDLVRRHTQEISGRVIFVSEEVDLSEDEWSVFMSAGPQASSSSLKAPLVVREVGIGIRAEAPEHLQRLAERTTKIAVVDRLREVRALEGYWRLEPDGRNNLVSVHPSGKPPWLPAVESYGEGVFLSLDEQKLQTWEKTPLIQQRVERMERDLNAALQQDRIREYTGPILKPRFVLLHTLAHMLIRQLSFDCGYSAASLRERVYARGHPENQERRPQAGVLIYTAAGDVEGTLGGLVRQGEPPNLAEAMTRMLESATWCSNDPLCGENAGQGFANLNRAACHACVLLPETSCETGNTLLDRAMLVDVGDFPGFFQPVVEAAIDLSANAVDPE